MNKLFEAKNISSLAFFRIAFGLIMCWDVCRYFYNNWISYLWIADDFTFTYNFFHWVQPWPDYGLYVHFFFLGVLAIFIALGLFYRISTILFFLGFTYVFLLDKTHFLNHFYLITLISFILIWLPAHKKYSIDSVLFPKIASDFVPYWSILAIQLQIGVAYFYGGIAKINSDWLAGEPMRMWIKHKTDFPLIGKFFTEEWMVYFFVYNGLILDLLIVPFLFWKKTRKFAFVIICLFHLMNANLFQIGIFPWFMIAATTIYFRPDWFEDILKKFNLVKDPGKIEQHKFAYSKAILISFCIYFFFQFTVPLRHHFIKGNVNWTEQGHRFAWHMKLRSKIARVQFIILDNSTGQQYVEDPKDRLSKRHTLKMSTMPDMILQYSNYLKKIYQAKGIKDLSIYVKSRAKLNGRVDQEFIDPNFDLAKENFYNEFNVNWILPLTTPLKQNDQ